MQHKIYIAIIITSLILGLLIAFVVVPTVQDIYALSDEVKQEKINLATFELKEKNIKTLKDDHEAVEGDLETLEGSLISSSNSLSLILPLEKVAATNNISQNITILSYDEEKNDRNKKNKYADYSLKNMSYFPVNIRAEGSFENIISYLVALENLGVYTDITSIDIKNNIRDKSLPDGEGEEQRPENNNLVLTLDLLTFTSE